MSKKKIFILVSLVVAIIAIIVVLVRFCPITFVNKQTITLKAFKEDSLVAVNYYGKLLETYDKEQVVVLDSSEIQQEIGRAVLERLIENILIQQELKKQLKTEDIQRMVNDRIQQLLQNKDISKEVETLYGLSLNEFKERIFKPEAKREILSGRLFLENKNFDNWLKESKNQAKVIILLPNLKWSGGEVVISE